MQTEKLNITYKDTDNTQYFQAKYLDCNKDQTFSENLSINCS